MSSETLAPELPPSNAEAEAAVLGSMLLDNQCIADVAGVLNPRDFYAPDNGRVFSAAVALADEGKPVDLVTLTAALEHGGHLKQMGGADFLVSLLEAVPSAANALYYAQLVHDVALRRRLIDACNQVNRWAHNAGIASEELLDTAQEAIFAVTMDDNVGDARSVSDLLAQVFEQMERATDQRITGVRTYFAELDDITSGLQNGELCILAGRPSMGKTTLALNIAGRVALGGYARPEPQAGRPVFILSMEMNAEVITRNILCGYAGIDAHRLRRGYLGQEEVSRLTLKAADLYAARIFIDDTAGLSLRELRTRARRLKMQVPDLALIVVDYLQLMDERGAENRVQEISLLTRGLKALARELDLPVLVLSQLSRGVESREGHHPRMSDLRDSGTIEQDADLVLLMFREDYYHEGERAGEADIIVAKQRNGPTGTFTLAFRRQCLRFDDLASHE